MGVCHSEQIVPQFFNVPPKYEKKEKLNLIIGIDCTTSNKWKGGEKHAATWSECKDLHESIRHLTLYEQIIGMICSRNEFGKINMLGFCDKKGSKSVFHLNYVLKFEYEDKISVGRFIGSDYYNVGEVLQAYRGLQSDIKSEKIKLGPTRSFKGIINKTIEMYRKDHISRVLVIICCADVGGIYKEELKQSIAEAFKYPISIICIGIGWGPWHVMNEFTYNIRKKYSNFYFLNFHDLDRDHDSRNLEKKLISNGSIADDILSSIEKDKICCRKI